MTDSLKGGLFCFMLALITRRGSAIRLRQLAVYEFAKSQDLCLDFCTTQGASVRQRRARRPLQKLEKVTSGTFSKRQTSHSGGLFCKVDVVYNEKQEYRK